MEDFKDGSAAHGLSNPVPFKGYVFICTLADVNSGLNIFLLHDFYLGGNFVDSLFVLSAAVATGAPGPPLPADVGSGETKGGACKRLAAAAGIWTGWVCHFLLVNLRDH